MRKSTYFSNMVLLTLLGLVSPKCCNEVNIEVLSSTRHIEFDNDYNTTEPD